MSAVPTPGERIGRFVIRDRLGEGGMGVVLAGHDPDLDRPVAIKLLRGGADHPGYRERLLREAQALARLHHPNVVGVHEVGIDGGRVYVAMELVRGTTLTRWLVEQPRSWREVVEMFLFAGEGLAAVHRAGLVHRDFKPDNVLIDDQGRARVVDFGLARLVTENSDPPGTTSPVLMQPLTRTGVVMGTPGYMAPEQQWGGDVDARADQYSYCVALRSALTAPARIETPRPVKAGADHLSTENATNPQASTARTRPAAREWLPAVPRSVRRAIDRGLSYDAADRFATMAELLAVLRAPIAGRRARIAAIVAAGVFAAGIAAIAIVAASGSASGSATASGSAAASGSGSAAAADAATAAAAAAAAAPAAAPDAATASAAVLDAPPAPRQRVSRAKPAPRSAPAPAAPPAAASTSATPWCRKQAQLYCTDDFKATEGTLAGELCKRMNAEVDKWERLPSQAAASLEASCRQNFPTFAAAAAERIRQFKKHGGPGP